MWKCVSILGAFRPKFSDTLPVRGEHDVSNESETHGNVLVLEDDSVVGPLIVRMLESEGYKGTLASDGEAARAALQAARYDVMLVDIVLGTQDGQEIAQSLVALQPGLRVVLMSGYGASRYGADPSDPMLAKPFHADELVERIERALAD
jgi:DNA-binding response OmpR family regulator